MGNLTTANYGLTGQSSSVSGYVSGGYFDGSPSNLTAIDKFPFASDSNASNVGDLTFKRYGGAGQSSSASGYTSGGEAPTRIDIIDKFPFATDNDATDVGDLTVARGLLTGQQY